MVAFPVEITNPQPETWSAPTVATLIIAGFALLVSLVSAAFNIWSWKAQGINGHLEAFETPGLDHEGKLSLYLILTNTGRMPLPVMVLGMRRKQYPWSKSPLLEVFNGRGDFPSIEKLASGPRPRIEPAEDMTAAISMADILEICKKNNFPLRQVEFVATTSVKDFRTRMSREARKHIERFQEAQENQAPDSDS